MTTDGHEPTGAQQSDLGLPADWQPGMVLGPVPDDGPTLTDIYDRLGRTP